MSTLTTTDGTDGLTGDHERESDLPAFARARPTGGRS
jgi:hypothetical protein